MPGNVISSIKLPNLTEYQIKDGTLKAGTGININETTENFLITRTISNSGVISVNGETGVVALTASDLGLDKPLNFKGIVTSRESDLSETSIPTISNLENYTPQIGDVIIYNDSGNEYVCIAIDESKTPIEYTWEQFGRNTSVVTQEQVNGNNSNNNNYPLLFSSETTIDTIVAKAFKNNYLTYNPYTNNLSLERYDISNGVSIYNPGTINGHSFGPAMGKDFIDYDYSLFPNGLNYKGNAVKIEDHPYSVYYIENDPSPIQAYCGDLIYLNPDETETHDEGYYGLYSVERNNETIFIWEKLTPKNIGQSDKLITERTLYYYKGNQNIDTVGTIISGTWEGSTVGVSHGGTGRTSFGQNEILYGSGSSSLNSGSLSWDNNWSDGTTNGPIISLHLGNSLSYTLPSIPVAAEDKSGVINTGSQSISGLKTLFSGQLGFKAANSNQNRIIFGTQNTPNLEENLNYYTSNVNEWASINVKIPSETTGVDRINFKTQFSFKQYGFTSTYDNSNIPTYTRSSFYEEYLLPEIADNISENKSYNILTTKSLITVAQGGTGTSTFTANAILYGNGTSAIQAETPRWESWETGTSAGPKAIFHIGGVDYTSAAIPSAGTNASGVITTGNQSFTGVKTFTSGNLIIKKTDVNATDATRANASYSLLQFKDVNDKLTGEIGLAYQTDGGHNIRLKLYNYNTSGTQTGATNVLSATMDNAGNISYTVADAPAFRTAINAVNKSGDTMTGALNVGEKVRLWTDTEGGNIRIVSRDGEHNYEIDGYNNNSLRLWTKQPDGTSNIFLSWSNEGVLSSQAASSKGISIKSLIINSTTNPTSDVYIDSLEVKDQNDKRFGLIRHWRHHDEGTGTSGITIQAIYDGVSPAKSNGIEIKVDNNGTQSYWVANKAAFRTAIDAVAITGDTITGQLTLSSTTNSSSKTTGALVVGGGAGFGGTIYANGFNGPLTGNVTGNVTGNASTATGVKDAGDTSKTLTIRYSGSGVSATDWIPMYDSNGNLVPVTSTNLANKVRDKASGSWGINITGNAATATTLLHKRSDFTKGNIPSSGVYYLGNFSVDSTGTGASAPTTARLGGIEGRVVADTGDNEMRLIVYKNEAASTTTNTFAVGLKKDGTAYASVGGTFSCATLNPSNALAVNKGGTGATTASAARTNLGITPANIGAVSKSGDSMTGTLTFNAVTNAISYTGTKATHNMIKFIDNTSDTYGNGISIGGGGVTVLGSGESAATIISNLNLTGGSETTYIGSDNSIIFYPNIGSWSTSTKIEMTNGYLRPSQPIEVLYGGTGATTAAAARTNLGFSTTAITSSTTTKLTFNNFSDSTSTTRLFKYGDLCVLFVHGSTTATITANSTAILTVPDGYKPAKSAHVNLMTSDGMRLFMINTSGQLVITSFSGNINSGKSIYGQVVWIAGS